MKRGLSGILMFGLAAVIVTGVAAGARAEDRWWHDDIHRFHEHDLGVWSGGRWFHGDHGGRAGWWWIVGGIWYFYPAPVYPYPDPYVPPVAVTPPPQYYYWCSVPAGYYPQVPVCRVPWQPVPAVAPAVPPPAPLPPAPAPMAPPPAPPPAQ
jgi:hypothetical protein